jgi:group I intron endonuclease
MSKPWYLYVITNTVNGKQYVGITSDVGRRKYWHYSGRGSKLVYCAVQKYGEGRLTFEVWYEGDEEWVKTMERRTIIALGTKAPNGYNLTLGGEGTVGWRPSQEFRDRVRRFHTGRKRSSYTRHLMSQAQKDCSNRDGSHQKSGNARRGCKHSTEAKNRMSEKASARRGSLAPRSKRVLVSGVEYPCISEAAIAIGLKAQTLSARFRRWHRSGKWPDGFRYLETT